MSIFKFEEYIQQLIGVNMGLIV